MTQRKRQLENAGSQAAQFTAPAVDEDTTLVFSLTVTNSFGKTDSDEVSVLVKNVGTGEAAGVLTIH